MIRNALVTPLLIFLFFLSTFINHSTSQVTVVSSTCATSADASGAFCPTNNCARLVRPPQAAVCSNSSCCDNNTLCALSSNAQRSIAYGTGLVGGLTSSSNTSFSIQVVDSSCNNITTSSSNPLVVQILTQNGTSIPATVVNNNNGTYTIYYVPSIEGFYTISASIDYSNSSCFSGVIPIYGSPYEVYWLAPSFCPYYETTRFSAKPEPPLARCNYPENACCTNGDVLNFGPDYDYIIEVFQEAPQCAKNFQILECGLRCSPAQDVFLTRESFVLLPNCSNQTYPNSTNQYRVCSYFAQELFNSCRNVPMNGFSFGDFNRSFADFIRYNNPEDNWPIVVTDVDCFNGTNVPPLIPIGRLQGGNGLLPDQESIVFAGTNYSFIVGSYDTYLNPRQNGGDGLVPSLDSGPANSQLQIILGDDLNGLYTGVFNATTVGTYIVSISNGTETIQRSPFEFEVVPANVTCAFSQVSPIEVVQYVNQPNNFSVIAYDPYGNRVLSGGDSSFFQFSWSLNGFSQNVPVTVIDYCNGTYNFSYYLNQTGLWNLLVVGRDGCILINTTIIVSSAPCPYNCSPGGVCVDGQCQCYPCFQSYDCAVNILTSTAAGPGIGDVLADGVTPTYFIITTNSLNGTQVYRPGITFTLNVTTLFGQQIPFDYSINDLGNGFYNVTYIPDASGTFLLYVQSVGCNVVGSPFTIRWLTNNQDCNQCCLDSSVCLLDPTVSCLCYPGYTGFNCCIPILQPGIIRFTDLGTAIIVPWTVPTNQAGLFGEFDCSLLFYNITYLGSGQFCDWPTPDQLRIWLGTSATVEVGNYLYFKPGLIGAQSNPAITYPQTGVGIFNDTIIRLATNPVIPIPIITAPYQMSTCATLILDGSYSTGSGGRNLFYQWSVVSGPNAALLTLYIQSLQQASRIIIPSAEVNDRFVQGYSYTFSLTIQNHFGIVSSSPAYWSVYFSSDFIPTITISPSYLNNFRVYTEAKLVARGVTSGCASPYIGRNDHFIYTWIQDSGLTRQVDLDTTNTQNAFIPAGLFQAGQNFTWQVRVQHSTFAGLVSLANAQIQVISSPPFVRILGGYSRSLPLLADNALPLQLLTETIDFDKLPGNFTYTWTCYDLEFNQPCFSTETFNAYFSTSSANITIPISEIGLGQFLFTVTIQKPGGRNSTADQRITTIGNGPGITADVNGLKNNFDIVNRNDPLHLASGISYGSSNPLNDFTNFNWTVLSGPNLNLPQVTSSSSTYLPDLVIPENVLGANQTFVFLVTGNNSLGYGFATVPVQVDSRPVGGICQVRVNDSSISAVPSGADQAYYDVFTIFCNFWEDEVEQSPVVYRYFLVTPNGGLFLLNTGKYLANRVDFTLPPGRNLILAEIANYRGDVTYVEIPIVTVLDPLLAQLYPDELAEWLYLYAVTDAIESSDEVALGQAIYYTARALNGNGNRLDSASYPYRFLYNQTITPLNTTQQVPGTQKRQIVETLDINRRSFWWNYLVQNLVYDYQVESNVAGLTQKLQAVVSLLNASSEVPDNALALLGNYTFNLLNASQTVAQTFSTSVNTEFINAAVTAINYLTTAVNTPTINGSRSTSAKLSVAQSSLNASQYLYNGILGQIVPGDAPTILSTPQANPDLAFGGDYLANVPVPYVVQLGGVSWTLPLAYLRSLAQFLTPLPTQSFRYGLINYVNSQLSVFSLSPNSSFVNTVISQLTIYSTNGTDAIYINQNTTVVLPHNVSVANNGTVITPSDSSQFPIYNSNLVNNRRQSNVNLNPAAADFSTPDYRATCLTYIGGIFTNSPICRAIAVDSSSVTCECVGTPIVGAFVYLFSVPAGVIPGAAPLALLAQTSSFSTQLPTTLAVLLVLVVIAFLMIALIGLLVLLFKRIRRNHPEEHVVIYSRWEKESEWAGDREPEFIEEEDVRSESDREEYDYEEEPEVFEDEDEEYDATNHVNSRLARMAGTDKEGRGMRGTVGTKRNTVSLEITPGEREYTDSDGEEEKEALSPRGAMRAAAATSSTTTRGV